MTRAPLILASASPRRLQLLEQIGITPDKIIPADIDETPLKGELPAPYVMRIATGKGRKIATENPDAFVLAADTTVACGRRIMGKAENETEERAFLKLLSGRRHKVITGIVVFAPGNRKSQKLVTTTVNFRPLPDQDIDAYIKSGEWKGKAGGYAIQGLGATFAKGINGSYTNVVGLSLYETMQMLKGLGFHAQN